eukprot:SAG22_NODE_19554_length_274_cov_0.325714_1_plen_88_part_10
MNGLQYYAPGPAAGMMHQAQLQVVGWSGRAALLHDSDKRRGSGDEAKAARAPSAGKPPSSRRSAAAGQSTEDRAGGGDDGRRAVAAEG